MIPLTKPQKLIYDMDKYAGGSISILCASIVIEGKKNDEALRNAANSLLRINDALRTRLIETKDGTMQEFEDYYDRDIEVLHFSGKDGLEQYAIKYAKEPLNLYGTLCEIKAFRMRNHYGILVKQHHIIGDAWSLSLIGSQFVKLINGIEPKAFSYKEYAKKEEKYLRSERYESDRDYFRDIFKRCEEVTYFSDSTDKDFASARKSYTISKKDTLKIKAYAAEHKVSEYLLFLGVLSVYFSRIKMNTEKFFVGTAVLNRTGICEKNTAGMFVNTVPMLIELDYGKTFAENIEEIKKASYVLFRHQKYNYDDVLKDIRMAFGFQERLYDVLISFQNASIESTDAFDSQWYHSGMQMESIQIHIDDRDRDGLFDIQYDYQIRKYNEKDIDLLHERIISLLSDVISNDTKGLSELNIISSSEKIKLLTVFNDTQKDYANNMCVHQLFELQARRTPNRMAVIDSEKSLTYRELNELSNRIAHGLIRKGVKKGDIVAFALTRNSKLIATIFAILKAGAAYLPIDKDYPKERIELILKDSDAKIYLKDDSIDGYISDIIDEPNVEINSTDLCYCIYTSGSTGVPKGTLLRHRGIVNLVTNLELYKNIRKCRRIAFSTEITFDVASQEIFTALLNGYSGVILPDRKTTKASEVIKEITSYKVDVFYSTPTYLELITDNYELTKSLVGALKVIVLAGEKFSVGDTILKLYSRRKLGDLTFENQYGPAETHVITTTTIDDLNKEYTIGKPISNVKVYITDKYTNLMPVGIVGELCIAGDGVGAGYLNRPDTTAEKFIDNPFGKGKLYKTGDLAYWREDGNIVYVGRKDDQVKIRGLRIELGEIENCIERIDHISQAAVVVRKTPEDRQLICAFYTGHEYPAKEIRARIREYLPKYMVPHIVIHLESMPLTASGKINRKALPNVDLSQDKTDIEFVPPETEKEKILVEAIEKVLNIKKVSTLDSFIDIGGDSLAAISLVAELERLCYRISIEAILKNGSIKELSEILEHIDEQEANKGNGFEGKAFPATEAQKRIYTAQIIAEDSTLYNIPYVFRVKKIDALRLQRAVDKLIGRHESLRTHFENRDGKLIQIVEDHAICKVIQRKNDDISDFIRPFDLSESPLFRIGYYEETIMLDVHHIIADGGSMNILLKDLNEYYMERDPEYSAVQYRHFAISEKYLPEDEDYWLSVFSDDLPELSLNTDFRRRKKQTFCGDVIYETLDDGLHERIIRASRKMGITPFVFYLCGFFVFLSKFSGSEDIIAGIPVSGRSGKFLDTIGMFVNTLAIRSCPSGDMSVEAYLKNVSLTCADAISHQSYPYGELIKKLNIKQTARNPLFDVMFAYQSEEMTEVQFGDYNVELLPIPITGSKYDFTFNLMPGIGKTVLMVEYCTDLYRENSIRRFVQGYLTALKQMLSENILIKDISVLVNQDRMKILYEFNNTHVGYHKECSVHKLFEKQVLENPNNIAVIACDRTLTYAELNVQANRIAHYLIDQGVTRGDIVAFRLSRNSNLFSVMLGILKAGGAYLPIGQDCPVERMKYIVKDSRAKVVITDDNITTAIGSNETDNPEIDIRQEDICYCIYTSGTTGMPKGVLITHGNVVNFCSDNEMNYFQTEFIRLCEKVICCNSIAFDISLQETFLPLLNGKSIILLDDKQIYDIDSALDCIDEKCGLVITPTKLEIFMENERFCKSFLDKFKVIMVGAEQFPVGLLTKLRQYTDAAIYNGYGPTETTCGVSYGKLSENDINIGKPIANTQIYILDKYLSPVPIGVTGELCIAGEGTGAGYLNRPGLTAEKFVDNPFGDGKLYKTGDLAYWREDGNIIYVGRNDFQVKIRGLRIELGEIENALMILPEIVQAAVVVRKNKEGKQLICAFYTGKEIRDKDIRLEIGKHLPKYMIPHFIKHIDEMPLTSSGKINRKALPEIDMEHIERHVSFTRPEGNMEKKLAALMCQVLGIERIGRDDDFFEMGGDSLGAIGFVTKAHNEGIYIGIQSVFDYPTVRLLAELIKNGDKKHKEYIYSDFENIDKILVKNTLEYMEKPERKMIGNILLAGATGFLGIHILAEYLDNDAGKAYCIIRGKDESDSRRRLEEILGFYFGEKYLVDERIKVLCGDLQKDEFGLLKKEYDLLISSIDTVINSAASVKHYGSYKYFEEANVNTTKKLIDFCKKSSAKLIHISTLSVSGNTFVDEFDGYVCEDEKHFFEKDLFIGQPLDNVYARSKFEAEKAVLEAMVDGLKANIMRMGNLTSRRKDGVFQKNVETNAFVKRIKSILEIKKIPDYLSDIYTEFTPVDEAARALMTVVRHFNENQTVFHINSTQKVYLSYLIRCVNELGFNVSVVTGNEFAEALRETLKEAGMEHIFETFINDMDENEHLVYESNIHIENGFTEQYLDLIGFRWKEIDKEYLKKYFGYLIKTGYLEV